MYRKHLIPIILLLCSFLACRKDDLEKTYPVFIHNDQEVDLNYKLYSTSEDYNLDRSFAHLKIAAGETKLLTLSLDKAYKYNHGKRLFVDVYSDDWTTSNWPSQATILDISEYQKDLVKFRDRDISVARRYYLDGDKTATTWRAFDLLDGQGQTLWDSLHYDTATIILNIKKDRTFNYTNSREKRVVNGDYYYLAPDLSQWSGCLGLHMPYESYLGHTFPLPGNKYLNSFGPDTTILIEHNRYMLFAKD